MVRVGHTAGCDGTHDQLLEAAGVLLHTAQRVRTQLAAAAPLFFRKHAKAAANKAVERAAELVAALSPTPGAASDGEEAEEAEGGAEAEVRRRYVGYATEGLASRDSHSDVGAVRCWLAVIVSE